MTMAVVCSSEALADNALIDFKVVVDTSRVTTRKVRFVSEHFSTHLLRADWEYSTPINSATEEILIARALSALPDAGAVVLSDYAKGALTPRVIRAVIDAANEAGKPVVVDPKGRDYSIYRGATLITPNRQELADATHSAARTDDEIAAAAAALGESLGARAVLVTRSEDGMTLVNGDGAVHVPAYPVRVRDVSGAGDTVVAVLAAMLAMKADFESAMRAANAAAAVVVGKRGTATLTVAELRSRILPASTLAPEEKIVFDWALLDEHLAEWRRQGLRIGFTNGCFDLLHPGHVRLLAAARAACDRLVLGLNGDASVTRLKGEGRPVQPVEARAEVLAALEAVDLVVVFDEDTPAELIARVEPTVLVKGGDYTRDQVVGADLVESWGGEVILVDLVPGHSTSNMVERTRAPKTALTPGRAAMPRLSAIIIAQNEAANIGACLDSVAFADERIVVDGGSSDDTVAIAEGKGARVVSHAFAGFGAQKNFALSLAQGDWVFSIDADERVSSALAAELQQAIADGAGRRLRDAAAVQLLRPADAPFRLVSRLCAAAVPARQGALLRRCRARTRGLRGRRRPPRRAAAACAGRSPGRRVVAHGSLFDGQCRDDDRRRPPRLVRHRHRARALCLLQHLRAARRLSRRPRRFPAGGRQCRRHLLQVHEGVAGRASRQVTRGGPLTAPSLRKSVEAPWIARRQTHQAPGTRR